MAHTIVLLVSAAVWTLGFAAPLQMQPHKAPYPAPNSKSAENDMKPISDIIQSANVGVPRLLIGGDIATKIGRNARNCASCRWDMTGGVVNVPFVISSDYMDSDTSLIRSALAEFSTVTCVNFINRTTETNFISIEDNFGCWSYIGKEGGEQTLSLQTPDCVKYGVAQHELMHALSFYHEHTRQDRDKYVDIMWRYISPENQGDFQVVIGNTLNIPYNYNSIMHYSNTTFSNMSGKPSIVPKPDPTVSIGQRYGLSGLDVVRINRLYACNLCRTKILGPSGAFSSSTVSPSQYNDNCLWLLHVPFNKVFLQFDFFSSSSSVCGDKIVVYDGVSKKSPILATVTPNQPRPVLISTGLFMLVEYIDDKSCTSSFDASYTTVIYGTTFTRDNGYVVSPNYPSFYPINAQDTSIIIAPPGFTVSLKCTLFDLESSPGCSSDSLVIRDGGDTTAPILGSYCGKRTNLSVSSTGQMMLLQFSSNQQANRPGYKGYYNFVRPKNGNKS